MCISMAITSPAWAGPTIKRAADSKASHLTATSTACPARELVGPGTIALFRESERTHAPVRRTVSLGAGRTLVIKYDFTNQGNGTVQLGNLLLRPYSEHDDDVRYQGGYLTVRLFPGSSRGGGCGLVVSGIAEALNEADGRVISREPVFAIYRYQKNTFVHEVGAKEDLFDLSK